MNIDVHAHFLPDSARDVLNGGGGAWFGSELGLGKGGVPTITTNGRTRNVAALEYLDGAPANFAWMEAVGVDVQVLSLVPPFFGHDMERSAAVAMAQDVNDEISGWTIKHPGRFLGFANVPLGDVDAAIAELERALELPGIVGAQVGTNVLGENWDADHLFAFLEAAAQLGAFLFLHPNDVRAGDMIGKYHLRNFIGNPLESTVAAASLIFGGVLDRLPDLKLCLAHGGGYITTAAPRFDHGQSVRPEAKDTTQQLPTDYLRRFYMDALLHSDRGVRHLVDTIGADRVVMGSDHPADMGLEDPVGAIERNPLLTDAERRAILEQNLGKEFAPQFATET